MSLIAASAGTYDLALVLGNLLIIILVARLAAEVAERLKIPAVLGEIVAGIIIGPSVLGWIDPISHLAVADMVLLLGEIGVILLLLQVGLEMDLGELAKVGKPALFVALIGVAVPFAAGFGVASAFGEEGKIALFIGAALTATSVGITARVLGDLRALSRTESRIVLGAAVADDVLGLVILTVVVKVVTEGSIGAGVVFETLGLALGFLLVIGLLAIYVVPRLFTEIDRRAKSSTTVVAAAFALTLGFSLLAGEAKLAFIIGAFMAGIGIGRSPQHERIAEGLNPLGHIFIPVFFASIGINADLEAMFQPSVLALAAVLTVVAILGKLLAGLGVGRTPVDRLLIGIGMIPRGEVGLIFASIGLSQGILDEKLYGALLLMVLVTTVVTPPWLKIKLKASDEVVKDKPEVPWSSVETSHLLDELLGSDSSQWSQILERRSIETRIPEIGLAMQRHRAEPDFSDQGLNGHLHALQELQRHLDDPRLDPLLTRALDRVGHVEIIALSCLIDSIMDDGQAAIRVAHEMMPDSVDDVIQVLSVSEKLKDQVRGPDTSVDPGLVSGDQYLVLSSYVLAALTCADKYRAPLDEAVRHLV